MDIFNSLQNDKIELLDELDRLFSFSSIDSIAQLPDTIDLILVEALKRYIVKYSPQIFGADETLNEYTFRVKGFTIRVESAADLTSPQKLAIAMLPCDLNVDKPGRKMREMTSKLPGTGAYLSVTFHVPNVINTINEEVLTTLAVEIFSLGYSWMNERIVTVIRHACDSTNRALYEYLRIMAPNKQVLEGFIFSAAADGLDFVVLDDSATRSSLALTARRSKQLGRSAASLALQMMLEVVPLSDSAIRDAVQYEHSIEIDLSAETYYQQSDDGFADSLKAVWGNTVSCFPIVTSGDFLLVAFYMTQYKPDLEPLLIAHRPRLKEIATRHRKEIRLNLTLVNRANNGNLEKPGVWAEIFGRFLGGIIKATH